MNGTAAYANSRSDHRLFHLFTLIAVIGAAFCLVLLGARIAACISFGEALQLQTSGDEASNAFVIWRVTQGLPVYVDPMSPPYYHPAYNWLFYYLYGITTGHLLKLFSFGDAWLPTVARLVSLAGMLVSLVGCYLVLRRAAKAERPIFKVLCLSFAIYIVAGPLIGFWNITMRADVWALTFEILGSGFFLYFNSKRRWTALLLLIVFGYLAWSVKQGNVFTIGAGGLFLLARRDFKRLTVLVIVVPAAWVLTFLLAPPMYTENILFLNMPVSFNIPHMLRNLQNFVFKSGPSLLLFMVLSVSLIADKVSRMRLINCDAFVFSLGAVMLTGALSIPASAQTGAAENYYFVLTFFITLFCFACLSEIGGAGTTTGRWVGLAGTFGWGTLITALVLVFTGTVGVVNVRPQQAYLSEAKRCLDVLPRPVFVNVPYLMMPWMIPGNESYTISYTYFLERELGRPFEHGGFGGLISDKKFAAVVIVSGAGETPQSFDGASLSGYKLVELGSELGQNCSGYFIFLR